MRDSFNHRIHILYGPTGVGKTDCAYYISQRIPVEIVNMDMGQLYTKLSIGTAKPSLSDAMAPHHLFNLLDDPNDFSCMQYREAVISCISSVWQRGAMPLLVGGSGFYLRALLFGSSDGHPNLANADIPSYGSDTDVWSLLNSIDPVRASAIAKNDRYRIERALTLWHATGTLPSLCKPQFNPIAPFITIWHITRDRQEIYHRINQRVEHMFADGLMREVSHLMSDPGWSAFLKRKKLIGYDDIITALEKKGVLDAIQLKNQIAQRTRHYAKRQETYWRMLEHDIEAQKSSHTAHIELQSINLTSTDIDLYIRRLLTLTEYYGPSPQAVEFKKYDIST